MFSHGASEQRSGRLAKWVDGAVDKVSAVLGRRPNAHAWITDVAGIVADLETLNRVTEEDFLAVGEKLMGFLSAARDIRAEFGRLADFISGESGERACQALAAALDRATEMQEDVERTTQTLGGMRHSADDVRRSFSGFDDIFLSFQVLATLGRIETARLGGARSDLGHFADAVRSCASEIQTRVGNASEAAAALEKRISLTINYVSVQDRKQIEALPGLLGAVREGLEAFRRRKQEASATSVRLAADFGSLSEALNAIVPALQFQDITRQRIEHVIDSLKQLLNNAGAREQTSPPGPTETAIVQLQRRQLLGTGDAFAGSVQRVKEELEQIAIRGRAMGEETVTLLSPAAKDPEGSFFGQMETCFAGVMGGIANCAALSEETTHAVTELGLTIAKLSSCVQDIQITTWEINRLAMNTTIQAAHLGAEGAPLSVVAGALQSLHVDAGERTCETGKSLAALATAVASVKPPAPQNSAASTPSDSAALIDELRGRIAELRLSSGGSLSCRERIGEAASQLYADVQAASGRFNIGVLVEETLSRCCRLLQSIGGSGVSGADFELEHLAAQYTMFSERDVHAKAANAIPEEWPEEFVSMAASAPSDDLGENVELF